MSRPEGELPACRLGAISQRSATRSQPAAAKHGRAAVEDPQLPIANLVAPLVRIERGERLAGELGMGLAVLGDAVDVALPIHREFAVDANGQMVPDTTRAAVQPNDDPGASATVRGPRIAGAGC